MIKREATSRGYTEEMILEIRKFLYTCVPVGLNVHDLNEILHSIGTKKPGFEITNK